MHGGALLGLLATLLRDTANGGTWTYLLDSVAWLLAISSAVAEARLSTIFVGFQLAAVRRRGIVLTTLGIAALLGGCLLLSTLSGDGIAVAIRAAAAALLIAGLGAGLGGTLSLAVTSGAQYAADRLASLDDN